MKRKIGVSILAIFLFSIALTALGYWVDSDPPTDLKTTVFEFAMMTALLFSIISAFYFCLTFIIKKVRQIS